VSANAAVLAAACSGRQDPASWLLQVRALPPSATSGWSGECGVVVAPESRSPERRPRTPPTSTAPRSSLTCSLPRLATPEDTAAMVAFLLSDDGAYINGQTILVDGGRNFT
jgi:NAD(P)-dependent dehydrogenase (short-subunit alcohol dehydrogenase family)